MAWRLLAEAETCPELISRSEDSSSRVTKAPRSDPLSTMALLSDPARDIRQYLEDLVRVAVGPAPQAEDISAKARDESRKARRSMALIACIGTLGLMVGVAGFTASRSVNVRLSEVRDEVSALQNMQQQARDQLADIASQTPYQSDSAGAVPPSSIAPAVIAQPLPPQGRTPGQVEVAEATPRSSAAPAPPRPAAIPQQPSSGYYTRPWPDSRPPPWRLYRWH